MSTGNPDEPPQYALLRGLAPDVAVALCYACAAPSDPNRVYVGAVLPSHGPNVAGFLCTGCGRAADPLLAEVAEAVNLLRALVPEIGPAHHVALTGALAEIAALLPASTPPTTTRKG